MNNMINANKQIDGFLPFKINNYDWKNNTCDANDLVETGLYGIDINVTTRQNFPKDTPLDFISIISFYLGPTCIQLCFFTHNFYFRQRTWNNWTGWEKVTIS